MAISAYCSCCRSTSPLRVKSCQKCGEPLAGEMRAYRVRVKTPAGWKSRIVTGLKEARRLEKEFFGAYGTGHRQRATGGVRPKGSATSSPMGKPSGITLGDVWKKFHEWAMVRLKRPEFYENKWRNYVGPALGDRRLDAITVTDIESFFKRLQLSKTAPTPWHKEHQRKLLSPKSTVDIIKLVGRLFSFAIQFELYQGSNPYDKFTAPRFDNRVTNDLKSHEIERFLTVLDGWENRSAALAFKLLLFTGKRTGEVFNLTWDSVNFESGFIRFIVKSRVRDDVQHYPMSPMVREIMSEAQACRKAWSPLVFPSETGKRILYRYVWLRIKKRAMLPKETRPHDLRHTFASQLISSGKVTIFEMQKLLSHKSLMMTERYSHLCDDALKKAARVADIVLRRGS